VNVVIFSFNRGMHLVNAVDSVRRHISGASILVIDDGSSDRTTRLVLDRLSDIPHVSVDVTNEDHYYNRLGGYYPNMRRATSRLRSLEASGIYLYMTDDQQVVRNITLSEMENWTSLLEHEHYALLCPMFLHFKKQLKIHKVPIEKHGERLFLLEPSYPYAHYVSTHIGLLRKVPKNFPGDSEAQTAEAARELWDRMPWLARPFLAHVPGARIYRRRSSGSLPYRIWARSNTGFFPILSMAASEVALLNDSWDQEIPATWDFLTAPAYPLPHPWHFTWTKAAMATGLLKWKLLARMDRLGPRRD
jgi:hypothetical protein